VQRKVIKEYEQEAAVIRAQIGVDISEAEKNITIINATGKAEAYLIEQKAQVKHSVNLLDYDLILGTSIE
jgi:hypothetical protein